MTVLVLLAAIDRGSSGARGVRSPHHDLAYTRARVWVGGGGSVHAVCSAELHKRRTHGCSSCPSYGKCGDGVLKVLPPRGLCRRAAWGAARSQTIYRYSRLQAAEVAENGAGAPVARVLADVIVGAAPSRGGTPVSPLKCQTLDGSATPLCPRFRQGQGTLVTMGYKKLGTCLCPAYKLISNSAVFRHLKQDILSTTASAFF